MDHTFKIELAATMRIIKWEKSAHALTQAGIDKFYGAPLQTATAFKFKTKKLDVPPHGGAFSMKTVLSGEEHYRIGKRTVKLATGQMMFINAGETYSSRISAETESVSVFVPEDERISAISSILPFDDNLPNDSANHFSSVAQIVFTPDGVSKPLLKKLIASLDSDNQDDAMDYTRLLLLHALRNLFDIAPFSSLSQVKKRTTRDELLQRLARARNRIDETNGDDADLDDLANLACLSKFYFLRLFTETFGEPPSAYARRLRLSKAVNSLKNGSEISIAARKAGYGDIRAFRRACKRTLDVSIPQKSQF